MFGFGETDVYDQVANPPGSMVRKVQDALQEIFGIAPCIFMGRGVFQYSLGIIPYRKPIYIVGEYSTANAEALLCPEYLVLVNNYEIYFIGHVLCTLFV